MEKLTERAVDLYSREDDIRTFVVIKNSIIVGLGDMDSMDYLDSLFVHENYQRQGIASALCDKLENSFTRITMHASITTKLFCG